MPKKLEKDLATKPGKVLIRAFQGKKGQMEFDPATLPKEVREKLLPFGLSHKLGDAAAGKDGADAEEAILKVWEGLKSGDWTVRAPAAPKVTKKQLSENLEKMDPKKREEAKKMLEAMGLGGLL